MNTVQLREKGKGMSAITVVVCVIGIVASMTFSVCCSGCYTASSAYTKVKNTDGSTTESCVKVIGTGDKASQIAADGLFADGAADALGAGVKSSKANQTSTGIDGTLTGMGSMFAGMAQFMSAIQAAQAGRTVSASPPTPVAATATGVMATEPCEGAACSDAGVTLTETTTVPANYTYDDTSGYSGVPAADGSGVYGQPSCGRCQTYKSTHGVEIININNADYRKTMWDALRKRGFTGSNISLPVLITADGYVQAAK